jgi:hypothetical protein
MGQACLRLTGARSGFELRLSPGSNERARTASDPSQTTDIESARACYRTPSDPQEDFSKYFMSVMNVRRFEAKPRGVNGRQNPTFTA